MVIIKIVHSFFFKLESMVPFTSTLRLMKTHHVSSIFVSLAAFTVAQADDSAIPRDSADLIKKLNDFAAVEQKTVDDAIAEKTEAVVKILAQHLERATKAGELDAAIALRAEIEKLTPAAADLLPVSSANETESRDLVAWLDGKVFFGQWSYGLLKIDFRDQIAVVDGKEFEIKRTRGREVLLTPGDPSVGEIDLEVTSDRTRATSPSRPELEGEFFVRVGS